MAKYKVILYYDDGSRDEDDEVFSSRKEADEHGRYLIACCEQGAEDLYNSNPGEWGTDSAGNVEYEVVKIG